MLAGPKGCSMLEAKNLSKNYGNFYAVQELSFRIAAGAVVGLLGPNGAGKTTTIRMLTTYLAPSSGTATVAGFDVLEEPERVRASVGYLPEQPPLYPQLRVEEYLRFICSLHGLDSRATKLAVDRELQRCGLTEIENRLCGQLSKGFKQRVGLAAALVHEPAVLILDEPTSGLDPAQIIEIRKLLSALSEKQTVILSTHILTEVEQTCSDVLIINHGRIVEQGSLQDFTKDGSLEQRFLDLVLKDAETTELTQVDNEANAVNRA